MVTDLEKRINDRQSTREAQKQDRLDKEAAKIQAEKEAKEAKEAAEIAKKEQEAAKKADILSGKSPVISYDSYGMTYTSTCILGGHKSLKNLVVTIITSKISHMLNFCRLVRKCKCENDLARGKCG